MAGLTVAVSAATGAQGSAIAQALRQAGHRVRGLTRRATEAAALVGAGLDPRVVDPADSVALTTALEGADALVLTSPVDHRPGARDALAAACVAAAARAGLRRIVLNTAARVPPGFDGPGVAALRRMRDVLRGGPVPTVVLQPTVYLDNLATPWAAPGIVRDGVLAYPAPPAAPIAWISHAALGTFAAAAVTAPGVEGATLAIGGPEDLTADALATRLGAVLGRPLRYARTPLPAFAAALDAAFGAPTGQDIADYYAYLETEPGAFARDDSAAQRLGVVPESLEDWAQRQHWPTA